MEQLYPIGHSVHPVLPSAEYDPLVHAVCVEVPEHSKPTGQRSQEVFVKVKRLEGQLLLAMYVTGAYFPYSIDVQTPVPNSEYSKPSEQSNPPDVEEGQDWPAGQGVHSVYPARE